MLNKIRLTLKCLIASYVGDKEKREISILLSERLSGIGVLVAILAKKKRFSATNIFS